MQHFATGLIKQIKYKRMKKLEGELQYIFSNISIGEIFTCPFCKYVGKNKRGTAKIFLNDNKNKLFKCFNCGKWRKIK